MNVLVTSLLHHDNDGIMHYYIMKVFLGAEYMRITKPDLGNFLLLFPYAISFVILEHAF